MKLVSEKDYYEKIKPTFLNDISICEENRALFKKFFAQEELMLKRKNHLSKIDESNYKTLNKYLGMIKNVNKWFKNKPLVSITEEDIARVYNDLEDGKIRQNNGKEYALASRITYYNKIFKSELFRMIEKDHLSKKVMKFTPNNKEEVRFITDEDFQKLILNVNTPEHKLLLWLAWDIGENINSLLKLQKKDFTKQLSPTNKEPEYKINLRREILKRSRRVRGEITNYKETTLLLDQILPDLKDEDRLFNYGYANAKKIFQRAVKHSKIKCEPSKDKPTWKDLRSGMACHLLKTGYNTDEVNSRLGHTPSSSEIDKYVNFLALDRHIPKKKLHQFEMEKLNEELNDIKKREKLNTQRNELLQEQLKTQEERFKEMMNEKFEAFKKGISLLKAEDNKLIIKELHKKKKVND